MIIWGAAVISLVAVVILLTFFPKKTLWWEIPLPIVATLLFIVSAKALVEKTQTDDTEYWGGVAQVAEYYEAWDEMVSCSHTKYCPETRIVSDGKGGTTTETTLVACGTEHLYDVVDHPPVWQIVDDNGIAVPVGSGAFEELAKRWSNRQFVELNRPYYSVDGDKYVARWDEQDETLEPVVTVHTYENRVQASTSVFNFQEVSDRDKAAFALFEYPDVNGHTQVSILGRGDATQVDAERALRVANAKLGHSKQAKVFILVFQDQPMEAGITQENYWKRGNKNEMVITIGIDASGVVRWCYPFSWTEVEELKIELRDQISGMGQLNLSRVVGLTVPLMEKQWERKHFRDFSYLTVEPPGWAVVMVYLLTVVLNLGFGWWIVENRYREYEPGSWDSW
jgi:hypothetical protein